MWGLEELLRVLHEQVREQVTTISNARLQLPDGQDFWQDNPSPEIATAIVTTTDANTVQITVTGINGVPEGNITQNQSGLVLSVLPFEPEEEVVVTAQKRSEPAQNVPISLRTLRWQARADASRSRHGTTVSLQPDLNVGRSRHTVLQAVHAKLYE